MQINQKQIVDVYFDLPDGGGKHPAIVLSNDKAIEYERAFIAVMLTTSNEFDDEFTFPIENGMCVKDMDVEYCQARVHLIAHFKVDDVRYNANWNNHIKNDYFIELVKQIVITGFDVDFQKAYSL